MLASMPLPACGAHVLAVHLMHQPWLQHCASKMSIARSPVPRLFATNMALGAGGPAVGSHNGLLVLALDPPLAPGTPLPPSALAVSGPYPSAVVRTLPWPGAAPGAAYRVAVETLPGYCGPVRVSLAEGAAARLMGAGGHAACPGAGAGAVIYERVCGAGSELWAAAPSAGVLLTAGAPRCLLRAGE